MTITAAASEFLHAARSPTPWVRDCRRRNADGPRGRSHCAGQVSTSLVVGARGKT